MSRIIGIDYGGKRTGIAVTDPLQITANVLTTVHSASVLDYLDKYFDKEDVSTIVVGYPLNDDGSETDATPLVKGFVRKLKKRYPSKCVEIWDERNTSKIAKDVLIKGGVPRKKRQQKELVDRVSAAVILQSYLSAL
jgi:putative Holliday junction resolvase